MNFGTATVARKPVHRGERDISRKTTAQGRPGCLRRTCMLVCAFFCATCTRDRGCGVHPVFPAPSVVDEGELDANLGRNAPRECGPISSWLFEIRIGSLARHCEERSDEAIHLSASGDMDCFAPLAMTLREERTRRHLRQPAEAAPRSAPLTPSASPLPSAGPAH